MDPQHRQLMETAYRAFENGLISRPQQAMVQLIHCSWSIHGISC